MSKTKECPYYTVNNLEEFNAAVKAMGKSQKEPLYNFPCVVGWDGQVFQCELDGIKPHKWTDHDGTVFNYFLKNL